ncbi:MAG: hypothetical protein ACHQHN_12815 [Sphingobacteriales bacterium]
MKQSLIYILKIWLTSSLLSIGVSSFYMYVLNYRSLASFGATSWMMPIIGNYWEDLEPGFIVLWLIVAVSFTMSNKMNSILFTKKLSVFILAESLTTIWIILFGLFDKGDTHSLSGLFLWIICSASLAFCIMFYKVSSQKDVIKKQTVDIS